MMVDKRKETGTKVPFFMTKIEPRPLSSWQVAISIITMHYGLGMLVGTGQDIASIGPAGMIYAVSTAVGTLSILFFSNFYWNKFLPIWDLFKKRYENKSSSFTAFLSGFWMIGVIASFILCGQAAAGVFGISPVISTTVLLFSVYTFSLFSYGWLSKLFFIMLLTGSAFLFIALFQIDFEWFIRAPYLFINSLPKSLNDNLFSVFLSTVLVTAIGMDFHQFVVRGKTPAVSRRGIIIAALILLVISFVIGGIVLGSLKMMSGVQGVEMIPRILLWSGTKLIGNYGFLFVLPILFVAIGSGSGLLKIVADSVKICFSFNCLKNKYVLNAGLLVIAFIISLASKSVVGLITAFYAIYVASVFIPFLIYLFEEKTGRSLVGKSVFPVILAGFISSLGAYIFGGNALIIIITGFTLSLLATILCYTRRERNL